MLKIIWSHGNNINNYEVLVHNFFSSSSTTTTTTVKPYDTTHADTQKRLFAGIAARFAMCDSCTLVCKEFQFACNNNLVIECVI